MIKTTQELLFKSSFVIFFKCMGALGLFGLNWLVANSLSKGDAGIFFWYLSFFHIFVQVCLLGLPDTLLKFVSNFNGDKEPQKSKWLVNYLLKCTLASGSVLVLLSLVGYLLPLGHLAKPGTSSFFLISSIAVLFQTCTILISYYFQSTFRANKSVYFISVGPYLPFVAYGLIFGFSSVIEALSLFSASMALNFLIAAIFLRIDFASQEATPIETSPIWKMAMQLWAIGLMSITISWGSIFIAGFSVDMGQLADLNIAARVAALMVFILVAVSIVITPQIAYFYHKKDLVGLQTLITNTSRILYLTGFVMFLFIWFFGEVVLGLIGSDYVHAKSLLVIISIGQLVNILTGPVGYLLILTGHEVTLKYVYIFSGVFCLLATLLVVDTYGVYGVAVVMAITLVVQNISMTYLVHKKVGVSVLPY